MLKPNWKRALVSITSALTLTGLPTSSQIAMAQESSRAVTVPAGLQDTTAFQSTPIQYLPFAHFAIPFDIDRTGRLPREVHLWVSADQGKTWLPYATNSPDKRSFEFQAAAEGEYLFAVQTQDDRGMSALAAAPPMRILVDTTKPQVQLSADINSAGRLVIDYRIEERYLSEESVRLSYSIDGRSQWEEIRVGQLTKEGIAWSGRIEQEMPRCREIELKLAASDLAQNTAETTARYNAPRTASAPSGMQLASQRGQAKTPTLGQRESATTPAAPNTPSITPQPSGPRAVANRMSQLAGAEPLESAAGAIAWEPTSRKTVAPSSSKQPLGKTVSQLGQLGPIVEGGNNQPLDLSSEPMTMTPRTAAPPTTVATEQPAEELARPSAVEDSFPVFQRSEVSRVQLPDASPSATQLEIATEPALSTMPTVPTVPSSPALNSVLERAQQSQNIPAASKAPANSAIQIENATVPSATLPRSSSLDNAQDVAKPAESDSLPTIVNDAYHSRSRSFSLDYSVEALRGIAISDIELWGTDDRGNTWLKWGSDPDRESPFDVQVGTDGLYGFRMVIIGQNGLVSNRPNDGDSADMWINVDTKTPSVKITRALYGEGPDAGMLVIDYSCDDENLHERPISLAYSERPTGPWSTIVTGLRNTGIYLWKADPNLPQQVYLRIQAVDRAGNVQEHRLELPINLRGLIPRGRIQGFRPIDPKP